MKVLPQHQIDNMVVIMDDILRHPGECFTVGFFKKKYNLSDEEYNMIFDLTMPLIREINIKHYWQAKYSSLVRRVRELCCTKRLTKTDLIDKLLLSIMPSPGEEHMTDALDDDNENADETEELEAME